MKVVLRSEFCEEKVEKPDVKVGQVYKINSGAYYLVTAKKIAAQWFIFNLSTSTSSSILWASSRNLQGYLYRLVEATLVIEEESK